VTRPLRAWAGGIVHESNSFSPIPTGREDFMPWGGQASDDPAFAGQPAHWPGYAEFMDCARAEGMQVTPGFFVGATPSAPASAAVWAELRNALLASLDAAGAVDIVWLVLHGAQMAEGCDDCEGELLTAVRRQIGASAAVGVLLDLHTNLSPAMLRHATLLVACKHYPHTDFAARAVEACGLLRDTAKGLIRPVMAAVRVPSFGIFPTTEPPFDALVARLHSAEARPGVLSASALHGFFGGDSPHLAGAALVVSDGDAALAQAEAAAIGDFFLNLIRHAPRSGLPVADALQAAAAATFQPGRPVVIADRADNAGGGAAGDSTVLLAALLAEVSAATSTQPAALTPASVAPLWDPQAAELAHRAGLGARLMLRVGGKTGPMSGAPLDLDVQVIALRDDAQQALFGDGAPMPLGRSAVLRAGPPHAPVDMVVNSIRQQAFSPAVFTAFGLDVTAYRLLVVKSTQHFHAGFAPIASAIVRCDAPGTVTGDYTTLPYRHLQRPMAPWDVDATCTRLLPEAAP
jgi:microcystin degradation protein MlrC